MPQQVDDKTHRNRSTTNNTKKTKKKKIKTNLDGYERKPFYLKRNLDLRKENEKMSDFRLRMIKKSHILFSEQELERGAKRGVTRVFKEKGG